MGRYDAEQLLRNINRFLNEGEASPVAGTSGDRPSPARGAVPENTATIKAMVIPELLTHAAVDKAPPETRLALFKKVMLVLLRPLGRRQAAFNHQTVRAVELLTQQVEALSRREVEYEQLDARFEELRAEYEALLETIAAVSDQVEELRDQFQTTTRTIEEVRAVVPELKEGMELFRKWSPSIVEMQQRLGELEGKLHAAESKLVFATEFRGEILDRLEKLRASGLPAAPSGEALREVKAAAPAGEDFLSDAQTNLAYVQFQRRFRGDEEMLRRHQQLYVKLIREQIGDERVRLLDVACGDGLFVEEARKEGWEVLGVDLNATMVRMARQRELPVVEGDALEYLRNAQDASFDVVTAFQFIEHLPPALLMGLLKEIRRVLAPGGIAIFETINPNSLSAMKWFHLDLTHERLIYPQLLEILVESIGLVCVEHKGISEPPEYERMAITGDAEAKKNFEKLNRTLYGAQDYYLVARKGST